ncbi:hypothetical protein G7048_25335 (plasmid) [Diaphorobacter sp. HDW4B]|uniref:glycosyltransferase n=1 Tax=Diaphorobacter sp. HDW4B TaxID=2714925 RepID=UPI001408DDDE|nr:glycosyltransferase [Diaphorobacter sp. HDW4B]QIL73830.1 hypothetical protein G7048_25335 [Diaphorobacter sp. HDW4B]
MKTSKRFHFICGLSPQTEPFHLVHYLCLASCLAVNQPDELNVHVRNEPYGPLWDRIKGRVTLRHIDEESTKGFTLAYYAEHAEGRLIAKHANNYAHEADFIRLAVLAREGGVYVDIDTLFVEPYPGSLYTESCVLCEEGASLSGEGVLSPVLCNAVIFAQPGSSFIEQWAREAKVVFDGTWSKHSCQLATKLWNQLPGQLRIAPRQWFYHFGYDRNGIRSLFEHAAPVPEQLMSIHLWASLWWSKERTELTRFHAGLLDENYVCRSPSTYAVLARQFL